MEQTNWARTLTFFEAKNPRGERSQFILFATPDWLKRFGRELLEKAESMGELKYPELNMRIVICPDGEEVDRRVIEEERGLWNGREYEKQTLPGGHFTAKVL